MKKRKVIITICSVFIIVLIAIFSIIFFIKNETIDFVTYESDLIGIDFNKYVINSSGSISNTDDYAIVKFEINPNLIQQFENDLESHYIHILDTQYIHRYTTRANNI